MTKTPSHMTLQSDAYNFNQVPDTTVTNQHLQQNHTQQQLQVQRHQVAETVFAVDSRDLFYAVESGYEVSADSTAGDFLYTNGQGLVVEEGCNGCWSFDPTYMKETIFSPEQQNADNEFHPIRRKYRSRYHRRCMYPKKSPYLIEKRNARERKRVQAVNSAFTRLRRVLPYTQERSKRVSKVRTLQEAIHYINYLQQLLVKDELPQTPSLNFSDVRPCDTSKMSAVSKAEQRKKYNEKNCSRFQTVSKLHAKGSKLNSNKKFKLNLNSSQTELDKDKQSFTETGEFNDSLSYLPQTCVPGTEHVKGTLPINSEAIVKEEYTLVSNDICPFNLKLPVRNLDVPNSPFCADGLPPNASQHTLGENYPKNGEEFTLGERKLPPKSQNKTSEETGEKTGTEHFTDKVANFNYKVVSSDDVLSRVVAASISNFTHSQ